MTPFIKHSVLLLLILALTTSIASAQTITSISPASVAAGSGFFVITVNGSNFSTNAIVEVNGNPHYTIDHSASTLMAYIYAPDVANPGTLSVSVLNGVGTTPHLSNKVSLTITGSGTKPPPTPPPPPPGPPPPPPPPQPGHVSITITSPVQNQQVCAPVTLIASAATSNAGAHVVSWQVHENGVTIYSTSAPTSSIDPKLSLSPGTHTLLVYAWDSVGAHTFNTVAFNVTTATPPCGGNTTGPVVKWVGCVHTDAGHKRQAIDFTLSQGAALPFDATLYFGANCQPNNWADRFGFGTTISFGGFSYIFWFRDFPDQLNTSAIWTVGNQSSGCINYNAVPAC